MKIDTITVITAQDGMVLTDGNIYGKKIFLAQDKCPDDFKEITQEQYAHMMKEEDDNGGIC